MDLVTNRGCCFKMTAITPDPASYNYNDSYSATTRSALTSHYQNDAGTIKNRSVSTPRETAYDCNTALILCPILWHALNWYREWEVCLIIQIMVVAKPLYAVQISCSARTNTTLQLNSFSKKYWPKLTTALQWPECCVERIKQYKNLISTQSILQMKNSHVPATSRPGASFSLASGLAQVKFASVSGVIVKVILAPFRSKFTRSLPVLSTIVLTPVLGSLM